jgi:hypothetical protein
VWCNSLPTQCHCVIAKEKLLVATGFVLLDVAQFFVDMLLIWAIREKFVPFVVEKLSTLKSQTMLLFSVCQTRLQTQAAGVAYSHPLSNIISRMAYFGPRTVSMLHHVPQSLELFCPMAKLKI